MEPVGQFLRTNREAKGITLEEVSEKTKIRVSILEAIEADRFEVLGSPAHIRTFVRAYAACLGIDEMEALDRLAASPGFKDACGELEAGLPAAPPRPPSRIPIVIVVVGIVLLVAAAAFLLLQRPWSDSEVGEKAEIDSGIGEGAVIASQDETLHLTVAPQRLGAQETATHEVTPDSMGVEQQLEFTLMAMETTWVEVIVDSLGVAGLLMYPMQERTWQATERVLLTLGNAGGVKGILNGRELPPFGRRGFVVRDVVVDRSNLSGE